jgi:2-dehydropantoate 2-reductase
LQRDGLTVESPDRTINLRLPAVGDPGELTFDDTDVVVFAMKTQHTVMAANALGAVAPGITVVSAQNGVQNELMLIRRFVNVYGICVMCPATHVDPGIVQAYSSPITGLLDIGRWAGPIDDTALAIASAINDTTFESEPRADIARWKYGKLLMNLGNAVEALCGHVEGIGPIIRRARDEGAHVLEAVGIDFVDRDEDQARRGDLISMGEITGRPRGGGSSWQSLQRRTGNIEVDYLNGEMVMLGRLNGVATPVNELLQRRANAAAVAGMSPGSVAPDELLAEIETYSTL